MASTAAQALRCAGIRDVLDDATTRASYSTDASLYRMPPAVVVVETAAINPALAISGIELIRQWYYNPDYLAIIQNCCNVAIGVWSKTNVPINRYGTPSTTPTTISSPSGRC
ncbi:MULTISPECIES: hypothetical protein [unclassified Mycolicibacterium]|uniref:hypothetical protein n=1 Tax=unclassified Mycolicibacterium TaxID=2636767 RepID=UPI0035CC5BF6